MSRNSAYADHLRSSAELVTSYEAIRAGFVALALEKNRRATPYISEARALREAASKAQRPSDLLGITGIEMGLLAAAGLSDKSLAHLTQEDKVEAIDVLIKNFLEPAGDNFVEELVFRYLLTKGDALGGAMRNIGGVLAQRKLSRAIISTLAIAGLRYSWQHSKTLKWIGMSNDDTDIELSLRGLHWENSLGIRTLIYNLNVPLIRNNVDMCLFSMDPQQIKTTRYSVPTSYLALGELKGGIDPAGADEHWKTARTALERVREAFSNTEQRPFTFFIGAAIQSKMAHEIWSQLGAGILSNAANLSKPEQVAALSRWLCNL